MRLAFDHPSDIRPFTMEPNMNQGVSMATAGERPVVETLITLVIYLIIVGVIYWAVTTILTVVPLPDPIRTVINVVMIVILVLIVVYALLGLLPALGGGSFHLHGF